VIAIHVERNRPEPVPNVGVSSTPIGLEYPFPTVRTADEFFATHGDDIISPIKVLTPPISTAEWSDIHHQQLPHGKIFLNPASRRIRAPATVPTHFPHVRYRS
jgi:hypothetical protein